MTRRPIPGRTQLFSLLILCVLGCPERFDATEVGPPETASTQGDAESLGTSTHGDTMDPDSTTSTDTGCAPVDDFPSFELTTTVQVHAGGDLNDAIAIGDFDGDGAQDVAVAWYEGDGAHVGFLRGNAGGGFEPPVHVSLAIGPVRGSLAAGRLDDDNRDDLAIASYGGGIATLLGGPEGLSVWAEWEIEEVSDVWRVRFADVGGDGIMDVVLGGERCGLVNDLWTCSGVVGARFGNGFGGLGNAAVVDVFGLPSDVAAADLDGDGLPEIIVPTSAGDGDRLLVFAGTAPGFDAQKSQSLPDGAGPIAIIDVDADDRPEVVVLGNEGLQIFHAQADGDLVFAGTVAHTGRSPVVADFNADGRDDLALLTPEGITILAGTGCGLDHVASLPVPDATEIAAADMNGSGYPDLLVMPGHSVEVHLAVP